jgi:hypothetical protein
MYTERDLDELIRQSITDCDSLLRVCQFAQTPIGFERIMMRVKQHILVRGIPNVDSALALVELELEEPYIETK